MVVRDGVCLFFENSTVCRMLVPCLFDALWPGLFGVAGLWGFVFFLCLASDQSGCVPVGVCLFSVGHSTESLILAQDERWRRA